MQHIYGKKASKFSDLKQSYGFLKRLGEEGQNVKIGSEINEILFLDDEKQKTIELQEEDNQKKLRKPRPRDVVNF